MHGDVPYEHVRAIVPNLPRRTWQGSHRQTLDDYPCALNRDCVPRSAGHLPLLSPLELDLSRPRVNGIRIQSSRYSARRGDYVCRVARWRSDSLLIRKRKAESPLSIRPSVGGHGTRTGCSCAQERREALCRSMPRHRD